MLDEITNWWQNQMGERALGSQDFLEEFFDGYCDRELEIQAFFTGQPDGEWLGSFSDNGFTKNDCSQDCLRAMLEDCLVFLTPEVSDVLRQCFDGDYTPRIAGEDFCDVRNLMCSKFSYGKSEPNLSWVADFACDLGQSFFWFDEKTGKIEFGLPQ